MAHKGFRWAAVIILLFAYILVSQGVVDGEGVLFNGLNSIGSVLLIFNSLSLKDRDMAVAVFNLFWLLIAMATILGII